MYMTHTPSAQLFRSLQAIYPVGEARAIMQLVMEQAFGYSTLQLCMGQDVSMSSYKRRRLHNIAQRLLQKEPVQYVLGHATFCGHHLRVRPGVLIPRPETEGLVQWVVHDMQEARCAAPRVLDMGTGSGCIAISLALALPQAQVSALDVSAAALGIARRNAHRLGARVHFCKEDLLHPAFPRRLKSAGWQVMVSNPPYVLQSEQAQMEEHVLRHEPAEALFVPDDDPLLFYRAIGRYALGALAPQGALYLETNTAWAAQTAAMLRSIGFGQVELRDDCFDRPRLVKCSL